MTMPITGTYYMTMNIYITGTYNMPITGTYNMTMPITWNI